jgi:hypothetical protein
MNDKYQYTYLDLRFHPYMFEFDEYYRDENPILIFTRNVLTNERYAIEDFSEDDVYEAFRRQFEQFVGTWTDNNERAFNRVYQAIMA